ncbi:alpha-hydroxy acid oxidase [Arthrobacter sp. LAPM80]|uniref:alpha-hydroxy acid oxidase n=1 Tax=Arthrobacter sp. LAPM80 TaxID=3141788 RepID=UPI00398B8606
MEQAITIEDLRLIARRRSPKAAFDYVDGAAEDEISLGRARSAFRNVEFRPTVLNDVSGIDLRAEIAGGTSNLPFGIAPTGFTRMMHAAGEQAGYAAAVEHGIPFALSTLATTSIEDIALAAPNGRRWFQLYVGEDRQLTRQLVERAKTNGYDTLLVTVDCSVSSTRRRDVRNGMTLPPAITLKTVLDASYRPAWWFDFLTTPPPAFASLEGTNTDMEAVLVDLFDPALSYADLDWLRSIWDGKLFVKGIQTAEDAGRAARHGIDGIVISNHGGRQLDRAATPLHELPAVRETVGTSIEIIYDTGILNGGDIVAALAAGADFVLVGRAWLYGLMAGGKIGVDRAIDILAGEVRRAMQLLGVSKVSDLRPEHVILHR